MGCCISKKDIDDFSEEIGLIGQNVAYFIENNYIKTPKINYDRQRRVWRMTRLGQTFVITSQVTLRQVYLKLVSTTRDGYILKGRHNTLDYTVNIRAKRDGGYFIAMTIGNNDAIYNLMIETR